jgi:predicted acylesterase/phospholipase RssA
VLALAELTWKSGLDSGDALGRWLEPILDGLGVRTFADLRLDEAQDPGMSLEADHQFRLVVHTADISRKRLVRLPWDFPLYGHPPDGESVVEAVRASMSIPFYFKPYTFESERATVDIPTPDGDTTEVTYEAGTETWVDGGMLRNFPINAFDRIDGRPPRWPTIGIKLSALLADHPPPKACTSSEGVGLHCLETMTSEWDEYGIDETTAARTIFVDTLGIKTIDFGLTPSQKSQLLASGIRAATQFVVEMGEAGRVPRTPAEAQELVSRRRAGAWLDADHRPVVPASGMSGTCSLCGAPFGTPPHGRRGHAPPDAAAVARAHDWLRGRPPTAHRAVVHRGRAGLS